jgi:hypothetical protein
VELAFSPTYLSLLALGREEIERVDSLRPAVQAYADLAARLSSSGSKLLIAYIPTKAHTYVRHLPRELLAQKLGGARKAEVVDGIIRTSPEDGQPVTVEGLLSSHDGQRDALLGRLRQAGIEMLDLTPILQERASRGEQLYWVRDNHWNSAGHEAAAGAIAQRVEELLAN